MDWQSELYSLLPPPSLIICQQIQELSSSQSNVTRDDVINILKKRFSKFVQKNESASDVFSEEWNFYLQVKSAGPSCVFVCSCYSYDTLIGSKSVLFK